jgi:F-type H+-transporting ATPase subunit alpha
MVATLNQPQYQPWPVEEQVVAIFAGINGYLDDIPTAQVSRFQDELREYLRTEGSLYGEIREQKDLSDDLQEKLTAAIEKFKSSFAIKEDAGLVGAAS